MDQSIVFSRSLSEPISRGLLLGRKFRTFYEFSIANGVTSTLKVTAPCEFALQNQNLSVNSGSIRCSISINPSSESTPFSTDLPIIGKNRSTNHIVGPVYVSQLTVKTGGVIVAGTEVEVFLAASTGTLSSAQTVSGVTNNERILPGGTYYIKLTNSDSTTAKGVFAIEWEELA